MTERQHLGRWGEDLAVCYLEGHGYAVLGRNFRTRWGEIDIVAEKDACLVFVEVRTKKSDAYGLPEESLTKEKRAHLVAAAQEYLQAHNQEGREWRIDLLAIEADRGGKLKRVQLLENAVEI